MQQKLCVLEVNEVPPPVWQLYARKNPSSSIARILAGGKTFTTVADDVDVDSLYPSQTWASLNTGLPYSKHKIHWYNDPKPNLEFFWWHEAALAGRSVGLVNVLHTSPLASLTSTGNYSFVLPDCFAPDDSTLPSHFQKFQKLNLLLTKGSGRRASLHTSTLAGLAGRAMLNPGSFGVSAFTLSQCARALPGIMQSPERLRNLQFPPLATIFMNMLKKCDPDVAVFFTNHVAAAQHRYWYALFPDDYAEELYPKSWVEKYETDILQAMDMLDRYLKKLTAFCVDSNRILVVVSSMGQHANKKLTRASIKNKDFTTTNPARMAISAMEIVSNAPMIIHAAPKKLTFNT